MKRLPRTLLCLLLASLTALGCLPALAESYPNRISLPKKQTVLLGRSVWLPLSVRPDTAVVSCTWESSQPGVATVVDGLVTGVSLGKAKITAATENGLRTSCLVTVSPVPMESFALEVRETSGRDEKENDTFLLLTGHKLQCTVKSILPEDASPTILWKSAKRAVAAVDANGLVTGKKAGTCLVRAASRYGKVSRAIAVKVVANRSPLYAFPYASAPQPAPGGGVIPISRQIYLKNDHLMIDMYMYNAGTSAIRGQYRMAVFLSYTPETDLSKYTNMGDFTVSLKKAVRPGKVGVVTVDLGLTQADKVVLLGAIAFGQEPFTSKRENSVAMGRMVCATLDQAQENFSEAT